MTQTDETEPKTREETSSQNEEKIDDEDEKDGGENDYIGQNCVASDEIQSALPPEEKAIKQVDEQGDRLKKNIEERKKTVKSDLTLEIISENDKKINIGVEENVKVDRSKSKCDNDSEEENNVPPALPPRPPRPRQHCTCTCGLEEIDLAERTERRVPRSCWSSGLRKYVFLCTACGSLSILLGALFLTVYFMLKSYTSSLNHFETMPTYVPSGMLIATGFLIICLAWRKNRNSFLMKLCGLCSLCCAVLCVSVTVTTTVIHMNRLQTLRECLYTQKTQSCTCYSVLMDNNRISDEGIKFVFNSTPDCEVIHGALYSCLRAIFGLSVIGILVCIFSCMLIYQLLSHEKKKMYWAQLEMRCRYLYRQQRNPHYYSCCDECRYPPHPHEIFPWELMRNRFWSTGRIGNLYTPNPEDRGNHNRLRSGWNWRRLPWSRGGGSSGGGGASGDTSADPARAGLGSPDSQYGFSSTPNVETAPYTVLDPRTSNGIPPCTEVLPGTDITEGGFYSWGPPPPYASNRNSANNSPARRSLGELLHHVSPVRRNDHVSPLRNVHHVHRHHMHHTRRCGSSPRQVTNNTQSQQESYQKLTPTRNTSVGNAMLQQQPHRPEVNTLWNSSISSVHGFQKIVPNKDNYENMYDSENLSSNGFNTLPILKKKNQIRISESIFQNEPFTAYFFSSAENLGSSTSNMEREGLNPRENLSPRVFLTDDQISASKYNLESNNSLSQNSTTKIRNEADVSENSDQPPLSYGGNETFAVGRTRPLRTTDKNTSLVKKLFVNCSPTKQKNKISHETQSYLTEKRKNLVQIPKASMSKKYGNEDSVADATSENVIHFRYRVGIPRSPNIENFNQFAEKELTSFNWTEGNRDGSGNESCSNDKTSVSEVSHADNHEIGRSVKYFVKDAELLQKHHSLMKEFNKTLDLGKNIKTKTSRSDYKKNLGIENGGFQQAEESKQQFVKSYPENLTQNPGSYSSQNQESRPKSSTNESDVTEDYLNGNMKLNENESDVYFGDISNSSCYGPESIMQEVLENENNSLTFSNTGRSMLNKQNLKMIEVESLNYSDLPSEYEAYSDRKPHHDNSGHSKHQNRSHRHTRPTNQYCDHNSDKIMDTLCLRPPKTDNFGKNQKCTPYNEGGDNKIKYFPAVSLRNMQDSCLPSDHLHESTNSNDEQSSSSVTADSGISSGRNYLPKCFESAYHEIDLDNRKLDVRETEALNEKYLSGKISHFETLGNFAHPLFQKPKVLPRGNRFTEADLVSKKKVEVNETEIISNVELNRQNARNRSGGSAGKVKKFGGIEEVSNQLLNTCNLTLSSRYLTEEDGHQFKSMSKNDDDDDDDDDDVDDDDDDIDDEKGDDDNAVDGDGDNIDRGDDGNNGKGDKKVINKKEDSNERPKELAKSLPKTRTTSRTVSDGDSNDRGVNKTTRFTQNKEKFNNLLAPDAQYEFQENYKPEPKLKTSQNLMRTKPPISARPLHLQNDQKKTGKIESLLRVQMSGRGNDALRSVPRRRRNVLDTTEGKDIEIGIHSVNV